MQPQSQSGRTCGRILPASRCVSIDVRTDRVDHYQSHLSTQHKCDVCKKNTRKGYKKYGCGLHDHCFKEWHGINQNVLAFTFLECEFFTIMHSFFKNKQKIQAAFYLHVAWITLLLFKERFKQRIKQRVP